MFTFIESSSFENWMPKYLSDDEYAELQQFLLAQPLAGDLVSGSGGSENYAGKYEGGEKEAVCVSFTLFVLNRMSFGC
jgi:hypothetical protein